MYMDLKSFIKLIYLIKFIFIYSVFVCSYYSNISGASTLGYKLPMAYFLTAVVVYIYSFVATLRK